MPCFRRLNTENTPVHCATSFLRERVTLAEEIKVSEIDDQGNHSVVVEDAKQCNRQILSEQMTVSKGSYMTLN